MIIYFTTTGIFHIALWYQSLESDSRGKKMEADRDVFEKINTYVR